VRPFGIRKYLRPDEQVPELVAIADRVVSGRLRTGWTDRFNNRLFANKRLIKDVRTNLMLKWLYRNFPGMPIILLIRHPCAVVHSYRREGWHGAVEHLLSQPRLIEDFLAPYQDEVRAARTPFERATYIWCVETLVPLKQFRPGEALIVFYEHLVVEPEREIDRMFSFLGTGYGSEIFGRLERPSLTTRNASLGPGGQGRLEGWRKGIDPGETRRILEIVRRFGLDAIYADDPLPDAKGLETFMDPRRSAVPSTGIDSRGAQRPVDSRV
jgi:hypothetical protein